MCVVTNIIVSIKFTYLDDDESMRPKVNAFFPEGRGLVSIKDPKLPCGWYGGSKGFEASIAIGAFNYLDMKGFVQHLASIDWPHPISIQIMYKGQEDLKFSIIDVVHRGWDD